MPKIGHLNFSDIEIRHLNFTDAENGHLNFEDAENGHLFAQMFVQMPQLGT